MKTLLVSAFAWLMGATLVAAPAEPVSIASPDGTLSVHVALNSDGALRYTVQAGQSVVLRDSKLGLVRDDVDFTHGLSLASVSEPERVQDEYQLFTGKRVQNRYTAVRRVLRLQSASGAKLEVTFQVSNDGVAFRYAFPEASPTVRKLKEEVTSFHFPVDARAWLQPMSVAKTGWSEVNPCYEEFYEKDVPVGTPSKLAGWVYPALFRVGEIWVVITEGSLSRSYCGTRLRSESPGGEYSIGFPDPRESFQGGPVNPESTLPWVTPWRLIAIGSLKTIVESTLGTDLAEPPKSAAPERGAAGGFARPGKAAWSWPLLGDRATNYEVQKRFIDYAADMGWQYCLIDALWDKQIGYEKTKELIDYAKTKNVAVLLWYNSAGDWNKAPQTPRDRMLTHDSRVQEFDRLKAMGVAGLKIDFFGGDGQSMINYYHDILEDAAPYGFLMNFHGATLPRGWQRTYPQLMTAEAIKGLEYITFEQKNADEEPTHAAMLPFTRNLFDPMDFTPVVLDQIRKIERRTTSGFELALSVLFTSGIQHYAEIPDGMAKAPDYVREFMKQVPSVWEDTKFIDGFPGRFVAVARRGDNRWFAAGINGEAAERKVSIDVRELGLGPDAEVVVIRDGGGGKLSFVRESAKPDVNGRIEVTLAARGGFVATLRDAVRIPIHDPVMARENGTYYLFATGMGISVWSSTDRVHWKPEKRIFDKPPAWAVEAVPTFRGHIWAPDISYHDGKYYLYYSVSAFGKNTSCIGVATNETLNPADPRFKWVDHGKVIQSFPGKTNWNAIDPNLIEDENGTPYLTFGSFWDGLRLVKLNPDRLSIADDPAALPTIASRKRDPKSPNPPAPEGNPVDAGGNAIEAPFIFKHDGWYYLFASIDYCCRGEKSTYKMIVGRAKSVAGPYVDKAGVELARGGGTLLLAGDANWYGLGHCGVYSFDGADYIVFHAYDAADHGRSKLRLERLRWDNGWPVVELK